MKLSVKFVEKLIELKTKVSALAFFFTTKQIFNVKTFVRKEFNMARIIGEQKNISENLFSYEKRLNSPYNRFIDKNPTYVNYYHISDFDTTVDSGWKDTEDLIGPNSSLRFKKIDNFPLYGITQIILQIEDSDGGLDTDYQSECIFLPHTIKPSQNDFFTIIHEDRRNPYLFRITGIDHDTIHPDNFYKAQFVLESTDWNRIDDLNNQTLGNFVCITENIGTEANCIIESDKFVKIQEVQKIYRDLADTYISIFYNERYNSILGEKPCAKLLYDPYLIEFCNRWRLFNEKDKLNTLILSQEIDDNKFAIKYERSVWRYIERNNLELINNFPYYIYPGMRLPYTTFYTWRDERVWILELPLTNIPNTDPTASEIFNDTFVGAVKLNADVEGDYAVLLKRYLRGENLTVYDVPDKINESLLSLEANLDSFFVTPMILYIIKKIINDEINKQSIMDVNDI